MIRGPGTFYRVPVRSMPPGLTLSRYERPLAERRLPGRHTYHLGRGLLREIAPVQFVPRERTHRACQGVSTALRW